MTVKEHRSPVMKRRVLVLSLLLGGLFLAGLGLAWERVVPSSAYWGPEQANALSAAQIEMHTRSHQHGADAEKEMASARERYVKISQELESARGSQKRIGTIIMVAGIALLLTGIALHLSQRTTSN
jgi:hypothetical protein